MVQSEQAAAKVFSSILFAVAILDHTLTEAEHVHAPTKSGPVVCDVGARYHHVYLVVELIVRRYRSPSNGTVVLRGNVCEDAGRNALGEWVAHEENRIRCKKLGLVMNKYRSSIALQTDHQIMI